MAFLLTLAYIFLLFVRPLDLVEGLGELPVMMVLGVVTLVVTLVTWLGTPGERRPSLSSPQVWLTVVFVGLAVWPWLMIGWLEDARSALMQLQPMLGAFFMVIMNVNTMKRLRWLVVVLVASLTVMAGEGLVSYYTGWHHDEFVMDQRQDAPEEDGDMLDQAPQFMERIRHLGFLNDPNDFAQTLVTMLPLIALGVRPHKRAVLWLALVPLSAAFLWTIVLTRSRGGLVAVAVTLLLALRDRLGRVKAAVLTGALVAVFLTFNLTAGRAFKDESADNRVEAWASGIMILRSNPIFGVGYNGFAEVHRGLTAHNSFVIAFTETGLTGYFFWMALLVLTYMELTRLVNLPRDDPSAPTIRKWARCLRLAISAFLVGAYFLSRTYVVTLYLLIAAAVCLKQIACREGITIPSIAPVTWATQTLKWEVITIGTVWLSVKLAGA